MRMGLIWRELKENWMMVLFVIFLSTPVIMYFAIKYNLIGV